MEEPACGGIYRIVHVATGREYIGQTMQFAVRWRTHRSELRRKVHANKKLQYAWHCYGEEAFAFEVIERIDDLSLLDMREQFYFDTRHPWYNLNLVAGGNMRGYKHSLASIMRNRRAHLGLNHTPETCAKMSATRRGKPLSPNAHIAMSAAAKKRFSDPFERLKISLSQIGKHVSPEHLARLQHGKRQWLETPQSRETLRTNALRQFATPEARYQAGNGNRGRKQSADEIAKRSASLRKTFAEPEVKAKLSATQKGKIVSPETRAKMAESQKKRLQNPELRARIAENTRRQHQRRREEEAIQRNAKPEQDTLW